MAAVADKALDLFNIVIVVMFVRRAINADSPMAVTVNLLVLVFFVCALAVIHLRKRINHPSTQRPRTDRTERT